MQGVATRDPKKSKAIPLEEFERKVAMLRELPLTERALLARQLSDVATSTLQAVGDAAVWEATKTASYLEVAKAMSYTDDGSIGRAVSRHNRRRRGEL